MSNVRFNTIAIVGSMSIAGAATLAASILAPSPAVSLKHGEVKDVTVEDEPPPGSAVLALEDMRRAMILNRLRDENAQARLPVAVKGDVDSGTMVPSHADVSTAERVKRPSNGPEYSEETESAYFSNYFTELDSFMDKDGSDRELTDGVYLQVHTLVDEHDLGTLQNVRCSATVCRIEVSRDTEEQRLRFAELMPQALSFRFGRGTSHLPPSGNQMVFYFSKQGSPLPRPSVPLADYISKELASNKQNE